MPHDPELFPASAVLADGLRRALRLAEPAAIIQRETNVYATTFPSEVVTVRLPGGSTRKIFCKYEGGPGHTDRGLRGGVGYESMVYERLLSRLELDTPPYLGTYRGPRGRQCWLLIEYLEESLRVSKVPADRGMLLASAWAGRFHAACAERALDGSLEFLVRFDAAYYRKWPRHLLAGVNPALGRNAWLPQACRAFEELLPVLVDHAPTIIHGEFTPHNVLFRSGRVYPIDWESAAVGSGLIDLALLLEGWPEATCAAALAAYRQARWPNGAPAWCDDAFRAARIYVAFRWLAASPEISPTDEDSPRLDTLREAAALLHATT